MSIDTLARRAVKRLLLAALEEEVNNTIQLCKHLKDDKGLSLVVRNGKAKTRKFTFSSGTIAINAPRVNDRREGMKFTSSILPPYQRKIAADATIPALHLAGVDGH